MPDRALQQHQDAMMEALSSLNQRARSGSGDYTMTILSQLVSRETFINDDLQLRLSIERLAPIDFELERARCGKIKWRWHSYEGEGENVAQALVDALVQLVSVDVP